LIGNQPFLSCKIDLKYRPLIPRPETEYWVEQVIADIKNNKRKKIKCLDMFAGSGCVGVAILKNADNTVVDFVDIRRKYIKQIKRNLKLNDISQLRYKIIRSNIFKNIKAQSQYDYNIFNHTEVRLPYDYILANPPYVSSKEKNLVQKSVLKYESWKVLFAGKDGLRYIKEFLAKAENYLNTNGKIYMEFGSEQKLVIDNLMAKLHYSKYDFYRDQYNRWRWLVAQK
jgi:release factor glutamine methyltransferase